MEDPVMSPKREQPVVELSNDNKPVFAVNKVSASITYDTVIEEDEEDEKDEEVENEEEDLEEFESEKLTSDDE
jgi:hypothetical protein